MYRFFKEPFYDRAVAQYAEDTKQPSGLVEILTTRSSSFISPNFTGPVMVSLPTPRSLRIVLIDCSYRS